LRRNGLLVILFVFLGWTLLAQGTGEVSLNVRYYDKKIYYPQSGPIFVQITISNDTPNLYHFRLADDRAFSLDFDTRTLANRIVVPEDALERKRSSAGRVFFRDITIESGESFSFIENIRDYSKIDKVGDYIVQVKVYPELFKTQTVASIGSSTSAPIMSNRIPLHIKAASVLDSAGVPVLLDTETLAVLSREKLSPDQVIDWTLKARQKTQWEKFFLYIDMEQMIMRDGARMRKWRSESEEGRRRMIASYRGELQTSMIDGDISAIPMNYEIERTTYNADEGTVVVLERFKTGDYIERKRYTYYLEKEGDYWSVVDYIVVNLGTE
jgi:hypothetical protein